MIRPPRPSLTAAQQRFHRELGRSGYAIFQQSDFWRITPTRENAVLAVPVGKGQGSTYVTALIDGCPADVTLTTRMALLECLLEEIVIDLLS